MVRLLAVVLFPILVTLVILAPVVVPWLFGPTWEPAVVPTQILAGAGAATVLIDQVGAVLMAAGRARTMLAYGIAHFAVYVVAVLVAAGHGLAAVSVAAVGVHGVFLVIAYMLMLQGRRERALPYLWSDVAAASVSSVALVAAALPLHVAMTDAGAGALVHTAVVGTLGLTGYAIALRTCFPAQWQDVMAVVRRLLPERRLRAVFRRVPILAGRS
jgi:O-antigen/teichoic acid export membrane protein